MRSVSSPHKWTPTADRSVTVAEEAGVRSLHIGGLAIQSAMRMAAPDELELHYTQAMMSFLLFRSHPEHVLMIGLGGGSIAKFIHRHMPGTRLTVVEVRNEVVAAARTFFQLPPEDERLALVVGDGARYVPSHPRSADVLLLDAFEDGRPPSSLCSQTFYDAAFDALRPGGVLAINFMAAERKLDALIARVERSFRERTLMVEAADHVNLVVLAFRDGPARVAWSELRGRAMALKKIFGLPFEGFLASLRERNSHTLRCLSIAAKREQSE